MPKTYEGLAKKGPGRPPGRNKPSKVKISVWVTKEQKNELEAEAARQCLPTSRVMVRRMFLYPRIEIEGKC